MIRSSRFKVLLVLTLGVLMAHLALLMPTPLSLGWRPPAAVKTFVTRAVTLAPVPQVQKKMAQPAPPASPKSKPGPPPKSEAAPQTASELPATLPVPPLPPESVAQEEPTPVPEVPVAAVAAQAEALAQPDELTSAPRPLRELASKISTIALPGSVRINYKVASNKFPFVASGELQWQHDNLGYQARLELSTFGQTRVQTSQGSITAEGLAPLRFSDKYRSEVAAHFNREQGKVSFSANTPDAPLLTGAQDRLSVLLQLAALVAGDPAQFTNATTLTLQVVGARDSDTWLFTVGEEETLALPGGEQRTLKLVRNPRREFDQKVELWLAKNWAYLPVRIKITEANGDFYDQKWLSTAP